MDFNTENPRYPRELVNHLYAKEVEYLFKLQNYDWCPVLKSVDFLNRRLQISWNNLTCEDYIPLDFKEQLLQITKDLHKEKLIKPNLYKKCFYVDTNNTMKAFAFYSTTSYNDQPVNIKFYEPLLNENRKGHVNNLKDQNDYIDLRLLLKEGYNNYLEWPKNPLPEIYNKVYNNGRI